VTSTISIPIASSNMGSGPSREEVETIRAYRYNDPRYVNYRDGPRDRDDYDECCGCGPWYGGESYRESRREWLPGFGSPGRNYFGRGGYAGQYYEPGTASALATSQMHSTSMVPYRPASQAIIAPPPPLPPAVIAPGGVNGGMIGGNPYRSPAIGMW
jgi:hypothetical protein